MHGVQQKIANDSKIRPWGIYYKYKGKKFIELHRKRGYFLFRLKDEGRWMFSTPIKNSEEVQSYIDHVMLLALKIIEKEE